MERREVRRELLDELKPDDPNAIQSRADLRRLNACMGAARWWVELIRKLNGDGARVVEAGAGDGGVMLKAAQALADRGEKRRMEIVLVDRHSLVTPRAVSAFAEAGWKATPVQADLFQWLENQNDEFDLIAANLILHHFEDHRLSHLLSLLAERGRVVAAREPRRSLLSRMAGRSIWALGANAVTRHDAAVSIRAGFRCGEISTLWPQKNGWRLTEGRSGLFSHTFVAARVTDAENEARAGGKS